MSRILFGRAYEDLCKDKRALVLREVEKAHMWQVNFAASSNTF
jgi:hypothetical protein